MAEFLALIAAFPTIVPTVMLAVIVLYWLMVMFGALDLHLFSHADGSLEGATKGVLEGATKGVLEGATKGVLEGATKGVLEGAAHSAVDGVAGAHAVDAHAGVVDAHAGVAEAHAGASEAIVAAKAHASALDAGHASATEAASVLSLAHFRSAPVTVSASVVTTFTWILCATGMRTVAPTLGFLPSWLVGTAMLIGSFVVSIVPASVVLRPLAKLFVVHSARGNRDLVGQVCVVSTGSVNSKFGQATLEDRGNSLILQVRSDGGPALKRGDRALIVVWDASREAFVVEPYDRLLTK